MNIVGYRLDKWRWNGSFWDQLMPEQFGPDEGQRAEERGNYYCSLGGMKCLLTTLVERPKLLTEGRS